MAKTKQRLTTAQRKDNRKKEETYLNELNSKIQEYDPSVSKATQFQELPLSSATIRGLKEASFVAMTEIQKNSIPVSLKGHDLLGAAKTGSGKTLAFLVPVLEKLYREKWTEFDGLGALIVSPTRELAMQIYEVLVKIGRHHGFSAGLVIGGKDVKYEMDRVGKINILIGTPGRILQHMDQSVGFNTTNVQMLVLDEADRCLDMGFKKTLDAIVSNLPPTRQTLLFSATQSQSLSDLARLSLTDYKSVGVLETVEEKATPDSLAQSYITVNLEDKLDVLFSFIKTHLKSKIIVFLSSSKQVHFVYETFRKLQPGISLMHLHGRQKQTARTETLDKFSRAQHVCLFATDVVARGIDFPAVEWVIQVDAPEDADTYIHRAGRSARFGKNGKALLFLTPGEEVFLKRLEAKKIVPNKLNIKQSRKKTIRPQLQSLLFKDPELKYLGQKAFISYVRSIYIQKDKEVFNFDTLHTEEFAQSMGLPGAPKIKMKGMNNKNKELKNTSRQLLKLAQANDDGEFVDDSKKVRTKYDKMFERKNQNVLSEHYLNMNKAQADAAAPDSDEEDDFMVVKRADHVLGDEDANLLDVPTSKRAAKKALSKKASLASKGNPTKLKFDDEGNAHAIYELEDEEDFKKAGAASEQISKFREAETGKMTEVDVEDKLVAKQKRQEKKRARQEAERRAREDAEGSEDEAPVAYLAGSLSDDMESDDEPVAKRPKWFKEEVSESEDDGVVEYEEPETLEDLEALTAKLIHG